MSIIDDKQFVYINSIQRLNGTSSDFSISINLKPNNEFDRVTLMKAGLPKSFYSVQTGSNTFILSENGVQTTCTLNTGNYTRNALATVLTSLLTTRSSQGWIYTVSFPNSLSQSDTGFFTYRVTGNGSQPSLIFTTGSLMNELCGFARSSTNVFVTNTLVSTQVCNLQPFNCIQVHSDIVSNPYQTLGNTDILESVFANTGSAPYSFISYQCTDVEASSQLISSGNTGFCRIYLTDEEGVPINTNGVDLQLVLLFWKKNKFTKAGLGFIKYITAFIATYFSFEKDEKDETDKINQIV